MDMPAAVCEPTADQWGLMRGIVVHDKMDIDTARNSCLDLVEQLAELGATTAGIPLPMTLPVAMSSAAKRELAP